MDRGGTGRSVAPACAGARRRLSEPGAAVRGLAPALAREAAAFARSRRAGAMLVGGIFAIMTMATVGALLTDYAWRDAQWAEIRSAYRAAVASVTHLLSAPEGNGEEIKERVAAFASGAKPGLDVEPEDVDVGLDRNTGVTSVTIRGRYAFDRLWGRDGEPESVPDVVRLQVSGERHEVAIAVDVSGSMRQRQADGRRKIHAVQAALDGVVTQLGGTGTAAVHMSIVPYAATVNVADTGDDPRLGAQESEVLRTAPKNAYLGMLVGANGELYGNLTSVWNEIDHARSRGYQPRGGQWVDLYHHYGAGNDMGPLHRQFLPMHVIRNEPRQGHSRSYGLRRTDVEINVGDQIPSMGTWTVDDEDFWNGCLMARWGNYWDPRARPSGWSPNDPSFWPAKKAVAAWNNDLPGLPDDTPLHLSDAPPTSRDRNTLFTAYSWPDARIAGNADYRLQAAIIEMLNPGEDEQLMSDRGTVRNYNLYRDNDWSRTARGGATGCVEMPIMPLTSDVVTARAAVAALDDAASDDGGGPPGPGTYTHLGVVWALRTLSPLWQGVWEDFYTEDNPRPAFPCDAQNQPAGCIPDLTKSILLIADGETNFGSHGMSRLIEPLSRDQADPSCPNCWNRAHLANGVCKRLDGEDPNSPPQALRSYQRLMASWERPLFHARLQTVVAGVTLDREPIDMWFDGGHGNARPEVTEIVTAEDGRFTDEGLAYFARSFLAIGEGDLDPDEAQRRVDAMVRALRSVDPTAYELFRGLDPDIVDLMMAESPNDDPSEPLNPFGLTGRPTQRHGFCMANQSGFGAYGVFDDLVYAGKDVEPQVRPADGTWDGASWNPQAWRSAAVVGGDDAREALHPGLQGLAPFHVATLDANTLADGHVEWNGSSRDYFRTEMRDRLVEWLFDACEIAGLRGVRIHAVLFSNNRNQFGAADLERCIDLAGGDSAVEELIRARGPGSARRLHPGVLRRASPLAVPELSGGRASGQGKLCLCKGGVI